MCERPRTRELVHELLLVIVTNLLRVVEVLGVDGVDVFGEDGDLGEETFVDDAVVGFLIVERDEPLVGKEDDPVRDARRNEACALDERVDDLDPARTTCPIVRLPFRSARRPAAWPDCLPKQPR